MTTAALNYLKVQKRIKAKAFSINFPNININWKTICVFGFLLSLSLLIYYVWQVNYLTKGSYLISAFEQQANKLSEDKKGLEVSFAESGFLGQVQQRIQALNFQKTTSVKYIQVSDNSFVTVRR